MKNLIDIHRGEMNESLGTMSIFTVTHGTSLASAVAPGLLEISRELHWSVNTLLHDLKHPYHKAKVLMFILFEYVTGE